MSRAHSIACGLIVLLLGGCTTYGVIDNPPIEKIDLDSFPVAKAVAASSAVPILFLPV